jgi:hypothetical protein
MVLYENLRSHDAHLNSNNKNVYPDLLTWIQIVGKLREHAFGKKSDDKTRDMKQ